MLFDFVSGVIAGMESNLSIPPLTELLAESPADRRRQMREAAIAAREALPAEARAPREQAICAQVRALLERLAPHKVGFCWPWRGEVDLRDTLQAWQAAGPGRRLALPVVQTAQQAMVFHLWQPGMAMKLDRHGIPVPANEEVLQPELLLVPLNAFDAQGYRLGYGGGYFDRTLAALRPAPLTVGVGFELGRVDSVLPQPHDCPMDWLVTEAGCFGTRNLRLEHQACKK